ncbi:MAG TPA: glycosyltransferase family 4 protein [Chloroflexota bacterium]|nr:glycosyltransferase family 4 protein [Chloroflexota bacterium]
MKLLVLTNLFPPHAVGGYEAACEDFVRSFHADDVSVLTTSYGLQQPDERDGVLRVLPNVFGTWPSGPLHLPRGFRRFFMRETFRITRYWIRRIRPDLCYIWNLGHLSLGPLYAARASRLPVVYHLEDHWLPDTVYHPNRMIQASKRWLGAPAIFGGNVGAIFVSAYLRRSYASLDFSFRRSRVVPNGIDLAGYSQKVYSKPAGAPLRLLFAGRVVPEKGLDVLLAALSLAKANAPGALQLTVAGPGPAQYVESLQAMAGGQSLPVSWLGRVGRKEMTALYRDHDLLAVPSVWDEPFGLVAIEAMASGTPVVAADSGGLAEIVAHGTSGLLVPRSNAAALLEALLTFVKQPALLEAMGRAARARAEGHFDLVRSAAEARRFIGDLAGA